MKRKFKAAVCKALSENPIPGTDLLKETDIERLPDIVKKYLRLVGCIGKEKIINFCAEFDGGFRASSKEKFSPLRSIQYNFYNYPARLFYMVASKMGIPAVGLHIYSQQTATMEIKVLGLFKVTDARGPEMNKGETVTFFNDMCFFAPATLISRDISWKVNDDTTVEAWFKNGDIVISATLFFEKDGKLINFISNDRCETTDGRTYNNYPWLTPVSEYAIINDHYLASVAKVIYRHPDEDFCYGEFRLRNIKYNVTDFKSRL